MITALNQQQGQTAVAQTRNIFKKQQLSHTM